MTQATTNANVDDGKPPTRLDGDAEAAERWYELPVRCRHAIDPRKRRRVLARIDALLTARAAKAGR